MLSVEYCVVLAALLPRSIVLPQVLLLRRIVGCAFFHALLARQHL